MEEVGVEVRRLQCGLRLEGEEEVVAAAAAAGEAGEVRQSPFPAAEVEEVAAAEEHGHSRQFLLVVWAASARREDLVPREVSLSASVVGATLQLKNQVLVY